MVCGMNKCDMRHFMTGAAKGVLITLKCSDSDLEQ